VFEAGPVLVDILKNRKEDVKLRVACAGALGEMKYKDALPLLIKIAGQEGKEEGETTNPDEMEEDYD